MLTVAGRELEVVAARICIGVLLKFMLGSDDLVWLAPFMARSKRIHQKVNVGVKYVLSVLFLTLLACLIAFGIHTAAMSQSDDDVVDQVIATIAAGLLLAYAAYMADDEGYLDPLKERYAAFARRYDILDAAGADGSSLLEKKANGAGLLPSSGGTPSPQDDAGSSYVPPGGHAGVTEYGAIEAAPSAGDSADGNNDDDEELGPLKKGVRDALLSCNDAIDRACYCCRLLDEPENDVNGQDADEAARAKKANDSVVVVAFLGSMDDFMVYFTLALSSQLTWYELTIGVTIGAVLIALIVGSLLQSSETLASCVETIPVPLVLVGLATFILVTAWTGFDGL